LPKLISIDGVVGPVPTFFSPHQSGLPQQPKVLGHSGAGDPEVASQRPDAEIVAQKDPKEPKAGLVPQSPEYREKCIHWQVD
jgi:hypothetical protein